jgi:hypothetical protein
LLSSTALDHVKLELVDHLDKIRPTAPGFARSLIRSPLPPFGTLVVVVDGAGSRQARAGQPATCALWPVTAEDQDRPRHDVRTRHGRAATSGSGSAKAHLCDTSSYDRVATPMPIAPRKTKSRRGAGNGEAYAPPIICPKIATSYRTRHGRAIASGSGLIAANHINRLCFSGPVRALSLGLVEACPKPIARRKTKSRRRAGTGQGTDHNT